METDNRIITIREPKLTATVAENKVVVAVNTNTATDVNFGNVVLVETDIFQKDYFTAGEDINGHQIVYLQNGKIWKATATAPECFNRVVGIIPRSVSVGESIVVKRFGTIFLSGLGLEVDKMYYLGTNGGLTSNPKDLIRQSIGTAISANELALDFSISIKTTK